MKTLLFALAAMVLASTAIAGSDTPAPATAGTTAPVPRQVAAAVQAAVRKLAPGVQVDQITTSPLPGFYQVLASGQLVYVSADGRYMLNGDLLDLASRSNLSEQAWAVFRKAQLAGVPAGQMITFAPPHPKYTIKVFTDVNCGYCRLFHEHIKQYNDAGIAVEYLAWPREGVHSTAGNPTPTYSEMVSVWCAGDRKVAFTQAKEGKHPAPATCPNPVADQYALGVRLGVDSTPTVVAPDGTVIGGYLPPDKLLELVRKHGAG